MFSRYWERKILCFYETLILGVSLKKFLKIYRSIFSKAACTNICRTTSCISYIKFSKIHCFGNSVHQFYENSKRHGSVFFFKIIVPRHIGSWFLDVKKLESVLYKCGKFQPDWMKHSGDIEFFYRSVTYESPCIETVSYTHLTLPTILRV